MNSAGQLHPRIGAGGTTRMSHVLLSTKVQGFGYTAVTRTRVLKRVGTPSMLLTCRPMNPGVSHLLSLVGTCPTARCSYLMSRTRGTHTVSTLYRTKGVALSIFVSLGIKVGHAKILPRETRTLISTVLPLGSLRVVKLRNCSKRVRSTRLSMHYRNTSTTCTLARHIFQRVSHGFTCPLMGIVKNAPAFPVCTGQGSYRYDPNAFIF